MQVQQFLDHHGVARNPFAEEDAQTDPVFKDHCLEGVHHPAWDKIFGDPTDPATSIVFGEKGAGKTALRLQIVRHVAKYNATHADRRLFVIEYDDLNPFLDRFASRMAPRHRRHAERVLGAWKLWDHIDAILSLGVTQLVDAVLAPTTGPSSPRNGADRPSATKAEIERPAVEQLDAHQARDFLLLAACYDESLAETFRARWHRLRRRLGFRTWWAKWPVALGMLVPVVVAGLILALRRWAWLETPWVYVAIAAAWFPWLVKAAKRGWRAWAITRQLRVVLRDINPLRHVLMQFTPDQLGGQPLPERQRTDDRFELLAKFQGLLKTLGYSGVLVVVDRVDEPHLVHGSPELMRSLVWPLLDNKLLKHAGVGFKLLLPIELAYFVEREGRDFYQRARIDKQNMVPSLEWSGEALLDLASTRIKACAATGRSPALRDLLDPALSDARLLEAMRSLRVPRHLFKFFHRLFVAHASAHTGDDPSWQISAGTFESVLALARRDQDAFERGVGAG